MDERHAGRSARKSMQFAGRPGGPVRNHVSLLLQKSGTVNTNLAWVRSGRCESSSCVEAVSVADSVLVRNSTDPSGPVLRFTEEEWIAFVGGVRDGDFDFGLTVAVPSTAD
jgi:hypothetical protein